MACFQFGQGNALNRAFLHPPAPLSIDDVIAGSFARPTWSMDFSLGGGAGFAAGATLALPILFLRRTGSGIA